MKKKNKRLLASGIAVAAAGVLGAESLVQTSISVQASAVMMPGIEQIVDDVTEKEPFRILEIVDSTEQAEIGYYVSGQEPYILLYTYEDKDGNKIHFSSLEEGLSRITDPKQRREFAENIRINENGELVDEPTGIRKISDVLRPEETPVSEDEKGKYPLSHTPYEETYFIDGEEDGWTLIEFLNSEEKKRIDSVKLRGYYQKKHTVDGNYTKEKSEYYPIRESVPVTENAQKCREDIKTFILADGMEAQAPYFLEFEAVSNSVINGSLSLTDTGKENEIQKEYDASQNRYGYFENVYEGLSVEIVENIENGTILFPGEKPDIGNTTALKLFENETVYAVDAFDDNETKEMTEPSQDVQKQEIPEEEEPGEPESPETEEGLPGEPESPETEEGLPGEPESPETEEGLPGEPELPETEEGLPGEPESPETEEGLPGEPESPETEEGLSGDEGIIDSDFSSGEVVPVVVAPAAAQENVFTSGTGDLEQQEYIPPVDGEGTQLTGEEVETTNGDLTGNEIEGVPEYALEDTQPLGGAGAVLRSDTAGSMTNPFIYVFDYIDKYPYYVYRKVGDLEYVKQKAIASALTDQQKAAADELITRETGDITIEDGQYYYWEMPEDSEIIKKKPLDIVRGRQAVSQEDVQGLPADLGYSYYYRAKAGYFCCKLPKNAEESDPEQYEFYGWYYPDYADNADTYIPVNEGETATYYMSLDSYKLTPGNGDYDFIPDEEEKECRVEVDHMYYKGGYENNDWLKRYVFNLSPEDVDQKIQEQFKDFRIQVDTQLADNFNAATRAAAAGFSDSEEAAAEFSDSIEPQAENTDVQETAEFSDTDTSEVSVPVSYLQEIIGLETTGQEIAAEPTENTAEAAGFTSGETGTTDAVDDFGDGLQTELTDGSTDAVFSSGEAAPAARAAEASENETEKQLTLADYDLVYVNGAISVETAQEIISLNIPCIVNQDCGATETFAALQKDDADGHYVNGIVYFFKNTEMITDGKSNARSSLLNLKFHTAFSVDEEKQGFEEITEYINNENKYREVAQSEFGDGEKALLDPDISQARAIEYILNYKYRRNVLNKDTINVLEIQPSKHGDEVKDISYYDVFKWIGLHIVDPRDIKQYSKNISGEPAGLGGVCSNKDHFGDMFDGDRTKFWKPNPNHDNSFKKCHFIRMELNTPSDIAGIVYTPGDTEGRFNGFQAILENASQQKIGEYKCDSIQYSQKSNVVINFDKVYKNVKYVRIDYIKTSKVGYASCAELNLLTQKANCSSVPEINITSMTSSEFAGKIQDLNTEYDMIFIGASGRTKIPANSADKGKENDTATLINGTGDMLYTHVGGAVKVDPPAANKLEDTPVGLLDMDYKDEKLIVSDYNVNGVGSFRGSGNDITQQQVDAVLRFAKSGYPVIVGNALWSGNSVNTGRVDNSSYMYVLLNELNGKLKGKYPNVCQRSDAEQGKMDFFANLPKPVIEFAKDENGNITGMPVSAVNDETGPSGKYLDGDELRYRFTIRDEAESSMVNAEYDCELFLDLNSDGNFSDTEKMDDIQIVDEKGNTLVRDEEGKYGLKLNKEYVLTRPLPEKYYKLITWKLKVSNNSRDQIYTTEQGYCKKQINSNDLPAIDVLQIYEQNWVLTQDASSSFYDKQFNDMLNIVEQQDFRINITTLQVNAYLNAYKQYYKDNNGGNYLDQFDMLIIGFADMFDAQGELKNEKPAENAMGAVDAIKDFIYVKEKSVLFAHDTTSFRVDKTKQQWGTELNKMRSMLGMDRYGIMSTEIGETLRKLTPDTDLSVTGTPGKEIKDKAKGDVAYLQGSAKQTLAWQTQGLTNNKIMNNQLYAGNNNWGGVTASTQVNKGAITEYPFKIPETITVAGTHSQYFQLALEEDSDNDGLNDIIVWYCLGGAPYNTSPNDVRNNYYLYSKGNIMYTGVGHSNVKDATNNINEKRLFVNTIVASYRASEVAPQVQFVNGFSRTAQKMQVDYYMTDQFIGGDEPNIVDNSKEIYFTVDDYNLVASDKFADDSRSMKLELFIDAPEAPDSKSVEGIADGRKVQQLDVPLFVKGEGDGKVPRTSGEKGVYYTVASGNVYKFNINDLEQYVVQKDEQGNKIGYKDDVKIYAKVYSEFEMYGEQKRGSGTSELSMRQRQLFDLD